MAYIFQTLANKGKAESISAKSAADAIQWYRDAASQIKTVSAPKLMSDKKNLRPSLVVNDIGKMFMYFYDPKTKDILPYYDKFPLIILVDFAEGGFYGLNLHYLPPKLRANLMDALYTLKNNDKYNESTKLKISYKILSNASKFKYFAPCFKRYLYDHVQGQYLNVETENWDKALMLPTERFAKASKEQVFRESQLMVGR
jgi:hypothetical protein